jgi:5-methylcytosine-specific restriction endonuclease McrA
MPATRPDGRKATLPRKLRIRTAECEYCGKEFQTANTLQKYCSNWCSDTGYSCKTEKTRYELRFGRTCVRCGEEIPHTARVNKKFCTESCQVCFNQELRRARKRGLPVERISRAEIFARDNYICHICDEPINDKPVLDHLIPLAIKNSPGHVKENVAAAHAYCNCAKNARVTAADYRMYTELCLGGLLTA